MNNKYLKNSGLQIVLPLLTVLLFVYILLFEFVLPINQLFPRPSILIESVPSLFKDYKFFDSLMFTISIIYTSLLVAYFLLKFSSKLIIKTANFLPAIKHLLDYSKYFLPVLFIFLFNLWFADSIWGEILFIILLISASLKTALIKSVLSVNQEYIDSAKSLDLNDNQIITDVIWKSVQPYVFSEIKKSHILLWSYAIIYEFICKTDGIGNVFRLAVKYNDISVVILIILVVVLFIVLGEFLLGKIKTKFFFWDT